MRTRIPTPEEKAEEKTEREYREKLPALKVDMALKSVLATREGRAVIRWIIAEAGTDRSSFSTNALTMAFGEGRRSVGIALGDRVKRVDKGSYRLMQEESDD